MAEPGLSLDTLISKLIVFSPPHFYQINKQSEMITSSTLYEPRREEGAFGLFFWNIENEITEQKETLETV